MAHGYINMVFLIIRFRDRVQSGDRPALDNKKAILDQTPFDVLWEAEMYFDLFAQPAEFYNLFIRKRLPVLPLRLDLLFHGTAVFYGIDRQFLGGHLPIDQLTVAYFIIIG